jgi:hypothetical protein
MAFKRGISVSEAFKLSRFDILFEWNENVLYYASPFSDGSDYVEFNSLSDARAIKYIYESLNDQTASQNA